MSIMTVNRALISFVGIDLVSTSIMYMDAIRLLDTATLTSNSTINLSFFHLNLSSSKFYLWCSRLGHVSETILKYLTSIGVLEKFKIHDIFYFCNCKIICFSSDKSITKSNALFELVHYDV